MLAFTLLSGSGFAACADDHDKALAIRPFGELILTRHFPA